VSSRPLDSNMGREDAFIPGVGDASIRP